MNEYLIVIRGAGDIATGVAYRLHMCGFRLLMLETARPTVIRRAVAFASAVFEKSVEVEGVRAVLSENLQQIETAWERGEVPVIVDESCAILGRVKVHVLIDATISKRNIGTKRGMADITIGLGPGFVAGDDVDAVIETLRGHELGRAIYKGSAAHDTGVPGEIAGFSRERIVRASAEGRVRHVCNIGDIVTKGQTVAYVDKVRVAAPIDGVLRGIIHDGVYVKRGMKMGDVDPRGEVRNCFTISEKALAVAGGVLEAILHIGFKKGRLKEGGSYGRYTAGNNLRRAKRREKICHGNNHHDCRLISKGRRLNDGDKRLRRD